MKWHPTHDCDLSKKIEKFKLTGILESGHSGMRGGAPVNWTTTPDYLYSKSSTNQSSRPMGALVAVWPRARANSLMYVFIDVGPMSEA